MFPPNIKRFVRRHCIGHSEDFKTAFYESDVVLEDGQTVRLYEAITETGNGMTAHEVSWGRPYVPVPVNGEAQP